MESDEEMVCKTRPKRQIRPPARFQDFQVQYVRSRPMTEHATSYSCEVPAQVTPFQSSWINHEYIDDDTAYPTGHQLRPSDYSYTARSQSLPQSFTPVQQPNYPEPELYSELQAICRENAQLLQSQQAFRADLMELNAVRTEFKELIKVAQTLRADLHTISQHDSATRQPVSQPPLSIPTSTDDEEWPEPPAWPEPESELINSMKNMKLSNPSTVNYRAEVPKYVNISQTPHLQGCQSSKSYARVQMCPDVLPPPPTPEDLKVLLSSVAQPQYYSPSRAQIPFSSSQYGAMSDHLCHSAHPMKLKSNMPSLTHPTGSEYVYRGPTPTIPKFSRPDPSEFARLRIALENLLPPDGTELFKYQILVDHLKLDEAKLIADAFLNSPTPFTDTMLALHEKFGQPHQLALRKIASVLEAPDVKRGDTVGFQKFALQVQSLMGLLKTLGPEGDIELNCGLHVARLLSKLPSDQRAEFRRHMFRQPGCVPTLHDLSNWLRYEAWCHDFNVDMTSRAAQDRTFFRPIQNRRSVAILHGIGEAQPVSPLPPQKAQIKGTFHKIEHAFTADSLNLSQQSYPIDQLQRKYKHLRGLPIPSIKDAQPLLLIGSDQPHLITPLEPIRLGPLGGPAAVHTRLGWTLQGPASFMGRPASSQHCLLTSILPPQDELLINVQRLWQMDAVSHRDDKEVTRSKQDQQALKLLETKTIRTT